jgi:hypothetical protein
MKTFLKSRKSIKEIYQILRKEGIFEGSYNWFAHVFSREKAHCLKNDDIETEKRETEEEREKFTTEKHPPATKENAEEINDDTIPEEYKLKYRANLEVPIDEVREALDAGAQLEDEYQNYTGVIYALGKQDARLFRKWLPQNICERHGLEYQEKGNIAAKADVIELLAKLKSNPDKEA